MSSAASATAARRTRAGHLPSGKRGSDQRSVAVKGVTTRVGWFDVALVDGLGGSGRLRPTVQSWAASRSGVSASDGGRQSMAATMRQAVPSRAAASSKPSVSRRSS